MKFLVLLIGFVFSTYAFSVQIILDGDEVNNGGGISESNIYFAYYNIGRFSQICLYSESCGLSIRERALLEKIVSSLDEEFKNESQIQFSSEHHYFLDQLTNGYPRLAKTGDDIGDPIIFNSEMLYQPDERGHLRPLSLEMATTILIHEFGHHHGIKDHALLHILGGKVGALLSGGHNNIPYLLRNDTLKVHSINFWPLPFSTILFLTVGDRVIDLGQSINSKSLCAKKADIQQFLISNLHWKESIQNQKKVRGKIEVNCIGDWQNYQLEVSFKTFKKENKFELLNDEILIDLN